MGEFGLASGEEGGDAEEEIGALVGRGETSLGKSVGSGLEGGLDFWGASERDLGKLETGEGIKDGPRGGGIDPSAVDEEKRRGVHDGEIGFK